MSKLTWYIGIILILWGSLAGRQEAVAQLEPQPVNARSFDTKLLKSLRGDSDYQYGMEPLKDEKADANESGSQRVNKSGGKLNLRHLWYVFIILLLGVLAYILLARYLNWGRRSTVGSADPMEELIMEPAGYPAAIQEAEAAQDWRLAIRLYFGWALSLLAEQEHIRQLAHKTNADYRAELQGTPWEDDFTHLARTFDYTWYGFFPVDQGTYQQQQQAFNRFIQRLT